MRAVLVGLGHRARHGKDTLASMIHASLPRQSKIYSLADDLKAYCRVHHKMTKKDSVLLQKEGQRIRQENGEDFWIRLLQLKIEEQEDNLNGRVHVAIIPDVRYQNELEWLKSNNGISVKVERLNQDGTLFIDPSRPANHPSEIELVHAKFDYEIIANFGDFKRLERASDQIVSKILQERLGS